MRIPSKDPRGSQAGELLIMTLLAVAILAVLAGMIVPVMQNRIDDLRLSGERDALGSLASDISATFDSTSYDLNISALPNTGLPAGTTFTTFNSASDLQGGAYSASYIVDGAGWQARLAARRGMTAPTAGTTIVPATGSEFSRLVFNSFGTQRCLLVGPSGESGRQRYLLVSLMAPAFRGLVFPSGDPTQLFNAIWDQGWESSTAQIPSLWSTGLSTAAAASWNAVSTGNRTNAARFVVARVTQPKYTFLLANNSTSDTAWVDIGPLGNAMVALPGSGVTSSASVAGLSSGILQGRLIVIRRGADAASATEVQRFFIYADVSVTLQ